MKKSIFLALFALITVGCADTDETFTKQEQDLVPDVADVQQTPLPDLTHTIDVDFTIDECAVSSMFLQTCTDGDQVTCMNICTSVASDPGSYSRCELRDASMACKQIDPTPVADFETMKCHIDYFLQLHTHKPDLQDAIDHCASLIAP